MFPWPGARAPGILASSIGEGELRFYKPETNLRARRIKGCASFSPIPGGVTAMLLSAARLPISVFPISFLLLVGASGAPAQQVVSFDSPRWQHVNSEVIEIGGRQALQGVAVLEDLDFRDGVVEYDLYITGARSYPGIYFRMDEGNNAEHFYVRPHRAGLYPDAIQYTPIVNGIDEWQLHNGPGYTSIGTFSENEWIPVRVEVSGTQARVFVEDLLEPSLVIPYLEGPSGRGTLALSGPTDGSAYFSNFRYDTEAELFFDRAPKREMPAGMLRDWEVSQAIPVERARRVFSGKSPYQGRDPSFLGILGLHDQVPVQVRKGLNEVFLMVSEVFGGWGFMIQGDSLMKPKPTDHAATEEAWSTEDIFLTPESVLKDPNRELFYVTSFDTEFAGKPEPSGFISRLSLELEAIPFT